MGPISRHVSQLQACPRGEKEEQVSKLKFKVGDRVRWIGTIVREEDEDGFLGVKAELDYVLEFYPEELTLVRRAPKPKRKNGGKRVHQAR